MPEVSPRLLFVFQFFESTLKVSHKTFFLAPIYEDVGMVSRDKGDDKYETLLKQRGGQAEDEYHTLQPEGQVQERTGGQYEPLKKEGMKEGVYHTVGMEGTTGGAGGYEALKKEGMKEGVYHTLGM